MIRAALIPTLAVVLLMLAHTVFSMSYLPPYPAPYVPQCDTHNMQNANYAKTICTLYGDTYSAGGEIPVKFVSPNAPGKYPLVIQRHGYTRYPVTCTNDDGAYRSSQGPVIVMQPCATYWPDQLLYPPLKQSWGGPWLGANPEGMAAGEALETAWAMFNIDTGAGVTIEGRSEGATFGILQSMIAPPLLQSQIAVVDATSPQTNLDFYYRDPSVQLAWGNFDISLLDFAKVAASGKLDGIYFRIRGGTNDSLGLIDLNFFRTCDRYRLACFGTWDWGGHNADGEAGVYLPRNLYNEGQESIRLDRPLPIFTNSSADQWGERGHHMLGLSARLPVQTNGNITVPIRYKRCTNLGTGIPDQPTAATFDFTLRRTRVLAAEQYHYTVGTQTGTVTVTKRGEITIEKITLQSSNDYTTLELVKI